MKSLVPRLGRYGIRSHLIRGAWIEMSCSSHVNLLLSRRISYEVRGLKLQEVLLERFNSSSHLIRGAWIEISTTNTSVEQLGVASHTRCVD